MNSQVDSTPQQHGSSLGRKLAIGLAVTIALLCGAILLYTNFLTGGMLLRSHLQIRVTDIPIYPNSKQLSPDWLSNHDYPEVFTRSFLSEDAPDIVWMFYVQKMGQRWGFYDVSSPNSQSRSLIVQSCPFYYLEMSSGLISEGTYSYDIRFSEEPCR